MGLLPPDDPHDKVEHALRVSKYLTALGLFVAVVGIVAVGYAVWLAVAGDLSWQRAFAAAFGVLAATVLSGAAAYGAGTNIGLSAERLRTSLQ